MRFFAPIFSVLAAVAVAQSTCSTNCILIPNTGLQVTAGERFTITWSNPSSGQITIKLQNGVDITPSSGITLATDVPASAGSVTVEIPSDLVNSNQYTFETIDQSNTGNINFSPMFAVQGATGVSSLASSTATSASSSSSSDSSSTASSSVTSTSGSSSSSSTSASRTSSQSSSRTSSSASSTAVTAAPNSNTNGASGLKVESALLALIAGAIVAF